MKAINRFLVMGLICAALIGQAQDSGDFIIPFSDPTKPGKLVVDIKSGSIIIKGTGRKDVSVKYSKDNEDNDDDKHSHTKSQSGRDGLKRIGGGAMDLEASEYQNTIKIISNSWNDGMSLVIEVPGTINIKANAYNDGDVEVTNIAGNLELTNYNGGITALNISGAVVAQTYNGDIKITYDKLTPETPLSYVNYNGDIDVSFPATLKAILKLRTSQGEIYTGFEGTVTRSNPITKSDSKSGASRIVIDDWVKTEIGGGGPEITMKSYNGDIYVRKK